MVPLTQRSNSSVCFVSTSEEWGDGSNAEGQPVQGYRAGETQQHVTPAVMIE